MRGAWAGGLGVTLGLWAAGASAGDSPQVDPHPPRPVVTLGRPMAIQPETAATSLQDTHLQPAAFSSETAGGRTEPIIRAQKADPPQPMPTGPALDGAPSSAAKAKPQDKAATPQPEVIIQMPTADPPAMPALRPGPEVTAECEDGDFCAGPWWRRRLRCLRLWDCADGDGPQCLWFSAEYLQWWTKADHVPALVMTSPVGTPREDVHLGTPGATVLFGNSGLGNDDRSGARFTLGFWLDCEQTFAIEGSYFMLGDRNTNFSAGSDGMGAPILARPFFNVLANREDAELVSFPGLLAGNVGVSTTSRLFGAELNLRTNCWRSCCCRLDWLWGFRYVGLDESLDINESLASLPPPTGPGAGTFQIQDHFGTHNNFYGGQFGPEVQFRHGRWGINLLAKVALGSTHEVVNINGNTTITAFTPVPVTRTASGGLLTQPTNIGNYSRDRFAVVPEAGFKVNYQLTPRINAFVGYSFLYLSDAVRPSGQIDRSVNPSQLSSQLGPGTLVGPARPAPLLKSTDFWAQGVNLGFEIRY